MFPNLNYAMALRGMLGYQLAAELGISESRFSRCLRGRFAFTPTETARISTILAFDPVWLFERPVPPRAIAADLREIAAAR